MVEGLNYGMESATPTDQQNAERARRAREERMVVRAVGGGIYEVATPSGNVYQVDLDGGRCTCPDHQFRQTQCKHLRRVAMEVTENRVPAPGQREATCADCRQTFFMGENTPDPAYCEDCTFSPGDPVVDRETGSLLLVVESSGDRASEVRIADRGWSVAEHYSNQGYDPEDRVVDVLYPLDRGVSPEDISPRDLKRYSFPRGRLRRPTERLSSRRDQFVPARQ